MLQIKLKRLDDLDQGDSLWNYLHFGDFCTAPQGHFFRWRMCF